MKKSEYIPDVSAAFTYASPRNFDTFVPKNFAAVGVSVNWEVFDWGRKKHQLAEKQKTIEQANNNLRDAESNVMIEVGARMRDLQQAGQALRRRKTQAGNGARKHARFNEQIQAGVSAAFGRAANTGDAGGRRLSISTSVDGFLDSQS